MSKMKPKVKSLWIDDLRANPELQGRGALCNKDRYCCMGRLCEIYRKETGDGKWVSRHKNNQLVFRTSTDRNSMVLPMPVQVWAGLKNPNPNAGNYPLAYWNDTENKTFAEIADLIEENL